MLIVCASLVMLGCISPWPAEPWASAVNLTAIEGSGTNDFHQDLSAAMWDPVTRRMWVGRNGPTASTSKLWALRESGATWVVDTVSGVRAEWTGLGDFEGVTLCPATPSIVYCVDEATQIIRAVDVTSAATLNVVRQWNISGSVPLIGGNGIEGCAFVPNATLDAAGFATQADVPIRSTLGLGGLFFCGNQGDGRLYVVDLAPGGTTYTFYGSLATSYPEIAEVTFDPSSGNLMVLHGDSQNQIEVCTLTATGSGVARRLAWVQSIDRPTGSAANLNLEGFALLTDADCSTGNGAYLARKSVFMTVDDGGAGSLFWVKQWPCICPADFNRDGDIDFFDYLDFVDAFSSWAPMADFNSDGDVDFFDYLDFVDRFSSGC